MKWITSFSLSALLSFSSFATSEELLDDTCCFIEKELLSFEDECELPSLDIQEEKESSHLLEYSQNALKNIKAEKQNTELAQTESSQVAQRETAQVLFSNELEKIATEKETTESFAIQVDKEMQVDEPIAPSPVSSPLKDKPGLIEISLKQVFVGAPTIYSLLLILSIASFGIWIYSMLSIRTTELFPERLVKDMKTGLMSNQYGEVLQLCRKERHFFCKMIETGILARKQGMGMMIEMMKAEGKRCTVGFWQRLNLLNDIALIAPLLGLLGTVMGMFYAFYDLHRSAESINILFDGLGISVGTTIAGLIVAIISMILHSTAKYRLIKALSNLENEAQGFAVLIETKGPSYLET